MIYSGEHFTFIAEHAAQIDALDTPALRQPEQLWLLTEEGDDVLDYRHVVARYTGLRKAVKNLFWS